MWTPALLGLLGFLLMAEALSAAPVYPVKMGPTGRYLVDQSGAPFLMAGESPQAIIGDLTEAEAELFFANRQSHGFNTVWINLLCNAYTGCRGDGRTFDGILPFTVYNVGPNSQLVPDLSTPNEAYFAHADRILRLAAKYGFLVILDPVETGGWLSVMQLNGTDKCREYGRFLGQRYASFDNILWMHGNDYYDHTPTNDGYTTAVALGIKDFDDRHIHTVELGNEDSLNDERWAPLIELNAVYVYRPIYIDLLNAYNRPDFVPTFLVESWYEFALGGPPGCCGAQGLRAQEYWSNLSGATGQVYGNNYTWQFIDGWKEQLDSPGAVQMGYVKALFEPRAWYELVPDQYHTVVTGGYGVFGQADYVTAGRTPDGTLVMAYVPSARTLTVDMTKLSGPAVARWYDPAAGTFAEISGSPFANAGSLDFTTPGDNADGPGNGDWVLVLEVPPSPAPHIQAASVSDTEIDLAWTYGAAGAAGFKLERRSAAGAFVEIAVLDSNRRSYADTGLTPTTSYSYRLRAFNTAGDSGYSNEASAVTLGPAIDVQPASWDYGDVSVGTTETKDFTVRNAGSWALNVSATIVLGTDAAEFSIVAGGGAFTLAPGQIRMVIVAFSPMSVGVKATTLHMSSDDAHHTPTEVSLTGAAAGTRTTDRPDLIETFVSDPPSVVAPGAHFKITDTVKNQGSATARPSKTRYFLSLRSVRSPGDLQLEGHRSVRRLEPGASSRGTVSVKLPSHAPLGSYYLLACADDKNKVTETDETNNCRAAAVQVDVARARARLGRR